MSMSRSAKPPSSPAQPVTLAQAHQLFAAFTGEPALAIAVSGGPDSMALLWLIAHWRAALKSGPDLTAFTVDHGLRAEAADEAKAVKRFAQKLSVPHRTLRWIGDKPETGLQEAARNARYGLLAKAMAKAGARILLTAHTLDDQAETVLLRLLRGSGLTGLQAMTAIAPYPNAPKLRLARPLLAIPKARLIATLEANAIAYADDPSNHDPRHTRVRLRMLMPALLEEGLTAQRIAQLAERMQRAEAALRASVTEAEGRLLSSDTPTRLRIDRGGFSQLPAEIGLRLLGLAIDRVGDEGPAELGKLESLYAALAQAGPSFRRTLAGAMVTVKQAQILVERAPPRGASRRRAGSNTLTTAKT